jgi:hypothetical protein
LTAMYVPSVECDPSKEWGANAPGLLKLLATVETHPEFLEACMSRERNLRNAALIAGCAVLLASCGGTETARNAASAAPAMAASPSSGGDVTIESPEASSTDAGVPTPVEAGVSEAWPRRIVCPERSSWTMKVKVSNATPLLLTLGAGSIVCSDWSGVSTPPTAMTGKVVSQDGTSIFTLEPSDNTDRNWTIGVMAGSREIGTFRARIPRGSSQVRLGNEPYGSNGCTTQRIGADPSGIDPIDTPVKIDDQTFMLLSDGSSIFVKVCGPDGEITDSVTGGSPDSGALEEQAQTDGPALASRKATTMCIENLSSATPVVTFDQKDEQAGEGLLKYRARACATGLSGGKDVRGRIGLQAPNTQMEFWADNRSLGNPGGGLEQEGGAFCFGSMTFSVGDRRTWDDGLLRYALEREPDGVGKVFRITIRDSAKPSADGKPAKCTTGGGTPIAL